MNPNGDSVDISGDGKLAVFAKKQTTNPVAAGQVSVAKLRRDFYDDDGTGHDVELSISASTNLYAQDVSLTSNGNHLVVLSSDTSVCKIDYYRRNTTSGLWLMSTSATQSVDQFDCSTTAGGSMSGATKIEISDDGKTIVVAKTGKIAVYMINAEMTAISYDADALDQPAAGNALYDYGADIDVSANGKTIIVGAPGEERDTTEIGAVHILRYDAAVTSGSKWVAKIVYGDYSQWNFDRTTSNKDSDFGESVSMSADGNYFAVGAPMARNDGTENTGGVVVFKQERTDDPVQVGDRFYGVDDGDNIGDEVELHWNGNVAVVGMTSDSADTNSTDTVNENHGRINVFRWDPNEDQWEALEPLFGPTDASAIGRDFALSADGTEVVTAGASTAYWYEYFWDTDSVSDDAKTASAIIGSACFAIGIMLL